MIPGTKARANSHKAFGEPKHEEEFAIPEPTEERVTVSDAHKAPSERHYSRRELFTNLGPIFGEGLTKLLRTSNHLARELKGEDESAK